MFLSGDTICIISHFICFVDKYWQGVVNFKEHTFATVNSLLYLLSTALMSALIIMIFFL